MLKNVEPREYQKNIAEVALKGNTLVVLPTGAGKTLIAVLVGLKRLQQYSKSRVLIMAPTRPLCAQHKKSFEKFTTVTLEEMALVTGKIRPEKRAELYKKARVIFATPQCIKNDLERGRLNLKNFSFVTFDECHRSIKDYAYPFVAKQYMLQAEHPLILGLTASPGSSRQRIEEITANLYIKSVEIRSEADKDMEPYLRPMKTECVYVELPQELEKVKVLFEEVLEESLSWLKQKHFLPSNPTKKMLLELQKRVSSAYVKGSKSPLNIQAMIKSAEAIKLMHAVELVETQDLSYLKKYLDELAKSGKRIDAKLWRDSRIREATNLIDSLVAKRFMHPKLPKLVRIVRDLLRKKPDARIIVFANYRATVERIAKLLHQNGVSARIFIGQAKKELIGMKQEEQLKRLEDFRNKKFKVLVATSIGEEGLDICAVEYAIFYEAVPSEIRLIQRRGRVGRQIPGKVIFLLTKNSRDEAYFFAALRKEKRMKRILYRMKKRGIKRKRSLLDWVR